MGGRHQDPENAEHNNRCRTLQEPDTACRKNDRSGEQRRPHRAKHTEISSRGANDHPLLICFDGAGSIADSLPDHESQVIGVSTATLTERERGRTQREWLTAELPQVRRGDECTLDERALCPWQHESESDRGLSASCQRAQETVGEAVRSIVRLTFVRSGRVGTRHQLARTRKEHS